MTVHDQFAEREVPTYPGHLTAIRAMKLNHDGQLLSPQRSHRWTSGENLASCNIRHRKRVMIQFGSGEWHDLDMPVVDHPVAIKDCQCGFYAYFDVRWAKTYLPAWQEESVLAIVKGYGRVTIGDAGMKAAKMEVIGLIPYDPADGQHFPEPQPPKLPNHKKWIGWTMLLFMWLFIGAGIIWDNGWLTLIGYVFMAGVWADVGISLWRSYQFRKALKAHMVEWEDWLNSSVPAIFSNKPCNPTKERVEAFKKKYPDIPIYDNIADALRAHPLSSAKDV